MLESAEVGSSIIRIRASSDSALAISTSCCSPTRSSATRLCGSISMPSRAQQPVRGLGDPSPIDDRPGDQRLAAEKDVVGRRQFGNEIEFLMDDRDARALGVLHARELHRRALRSDDFRRIRRARRREFSSACFCRRRSRRRARELRRPSNRSRRRAAPPLRRRIWRRARLAGRRRHLRAASRPAAGIRRAGQSGRGVSCFMHWSDVRLHPLMIFLCGSPEARTPPATRAIAPDVRSAAFLVNLRPSAPDAERSDVNT